MKVNEEVAIVFRTHYWNQDTEILAKKLYGQSIGYSFFVFCDETNGPIDIKEFDKISHTNDPASLGLLPKRGHKPSLWYDGDFAFYYLIRALPNVKYFLMIENDCSLNIPLTNIIEKVILEKIDLVGKIYNFKDERLKKTVEPYYSNLKQMLFPFVMMSRRLIDRMYAERQRILDIYDQDPERNPWPFCEAIVSSYAASVDDVKILNLNDMYDMSRFQYRPHHYMHSGIANIPGTIIHPVLGLSFLEKRLEFSSVEDIFNPRSDLRANIETISPDFFVPIIYKWILKLKKPEKVDQFLYLALKNNWIQKLPRKNLAFAKPALQSSTSQWSMSRDIKQDAMHVTCAFDYVSQTNHTAMEKNPWWQVDLEKETQFSTIIIYPREEAYERMNRFELLVSNDGVDWTEIFVKNDDEPIFRGRNIGYVVNMDLECSFRFIRLVVLGEKTAVHLNAFEVYS